MGGEGSPLSETLLEAPGRADNITRRLELFRLIPDTLWCLTDSSGAPPHPPGPQQAGTPGAFRERLLGAASVPSEDPWVPEGLPDPEEQAEAKKLPRGLCTCCALCLECLSPVLHDLLPPFKFLWPRDSQKHAGKVPGPCVFMVSQHPLAVLGWREAARGRADRCRLHHYQRVDPLTPPSPSSLLQITGEIGSSEGGIR